MIKQLLLAGAAAAIPSSTAVAAEYYIVQEKSTKRCRVVDARPTETTWVQVGDIAFKTRDEADKQLTLKCKVKR
jgi:hypothetical protein